MAMAALFEMYGERRTIWEVPQVCRKTLIIRCLVGSAAFLMTTEALKLIPLSFFTMIINTSPFLTAILQYFWIREKVAKFEIVAMIGCYGGIMLLSATSLLNGQSNAQST
jgi:drug/metabolite transporter (DMT)-like permease